MRIGIDARMYGAQATTGIGVYIDELTKNLFNLDQTNEYILLLRPAAYSHFKPPNPRVRAVKVDIPWYGWSEQLFLPSVLRKLKLDLVHFPHFNVPIFYRGKFVVTIHDITPLFFPGPKVRRSMLRKLGYNKIMRHALKHACKIITNSKHTSDQLQKHYQVDSGQIKVSLLGVDLTSYSRSDDNTIDAIKKTFKLTKPSILYVGVWRDHKNIPGLVKGYEILRDRGIDAQLILTGKPNPEYPEILKSIERSPHRKDIVLAGFVKQSDLVGLYSAANIFVLPSFQEGFGLVAFEALACGTPVVAATTTGLPDLLHDSALYFDPNNPQQLADRLEQLLKNPQLGKNLVSQATGKLKNYSWAKTAHDTLQVYRAC